MKILFYKKIFNRNFSIYDRLGVADIPGILPDGVEVNFSSDPMDLHSADVVIWDIPFLRGEYTAWSKPKGQIWVGWLLESVLVYPWVKEVMGLFDVSMTYRLDSDVPIPYFYHSYVDGVRTMPAVKNRGVASFVGSSVNRSHRLEYLDALMEHMRIDTYGYKKNTLIKDRDYRTKQEESKAYRFVLAFENAIEPEWITEKFFDPFLVGSVPVYLGTPDIEEYAPGDHCYINANNMPPVDLAGLLGEYINNDVLYEGLFEWKTKPLRPGFLSKMEQVREHFILRLLDKLEEKGLWNKKSC